MCRQAVGVPTAALPLSCIPQQPTQSTEGDGLNAAAKRKILLAAMNDEGAIGFEILDGDPEPSGHRWRYGPLDLDGPASQLAAKIKNEIHLCAGARCGVRGCRSGSTMPRPTISPLAKTWTRIACERVSSLEAASAGSAASSAKT